MSYLTITHNNQTFYFRKGKPLTKQFGRATQIQDRTIEKAKAEAKEIASETFEGSFTLTILANDGVTKGKSEEFDIKPAETETTETVATAGQSPMVVRGIAARKRIIAKLEKFVTRMTAKADKAKATMERSTNRANAKAADIAVLKAELFKLENPTTEVVEAATVEEVVAAV